MQLEDYLELNNPNGIRLKGTRISIEHIVYELREGLSADDIVADFYPSLTLEQVHAALAYYYRNRSAIDSYVAAQESKVATAKRMHEQTSEPAPLRRLRQQLAAGRGKVVS
jgi:uncharacterized protein (DUF433 family)